MIEVSRIGFIYTVEVVDLAGNIKEAESCCNLIPDVGRDYALAAALLGGAQLSSWYIGLFGNDYEPVHGDTMTSLLNNAGEIESYDTTDNKRLGLTPDELASGLFANQVSPAEFVFPAGATVRGGFITSNNLRGNTSGTLLSAARFPSPKIAEDGEIIRVKAGLQLIT